MIACIYNDLKKRIENIWIFKKININDEKNILKILFRKENVKGEEKKKYFQSKSVCVKQHVLCFRKIETLMIEEAQWCISYTIYTTERFWEN